MSKSFDDLLKKLEVCKKKVIAVAAAQDEAVLEAVAGAKRQGIADAILFGSKKEIEQAALHVDIDLNDFEIRDIEDKVEAAFGKKLNDQNRMSLPGVVSRKKQVVPPLTDAFA